MNSIRLLIALAVVATLCGCDAKPAVEAEPPAETTVAPAKSPALDPVHLDEPGEVHLGAHMYELSRRFAAVWFAGHSGNAGMVEYQLHEMHEVIEELEKGGAKEAGIDVAARLEADIESQFDTLQGAVEKRDKEAFEATYRAMMGKCTACHTETKHPFIVVREPTYNPYSNLSF